MKRIFLLLLYLARENPLIFLAFLFNILIFLFVFFNLVLFLSKKKRKISFPFKHLKSLVSSLSWKLEKKPNKVDNVENLYSFCIQKLRIDGILDEKDGKGYLARKKALEKTKGKIRKVLEKIFELYEMKIYGKREIPNEKQIVNDLFNLFLKS